MTAKVIRMRKPALMECSACGASASAACDCGAAYVPAMQRAAAAAKASPQKSDRVIAAEIGVGKDTVRRARKLTGASAPVDKRVGKDGKARRVPTRPAPVISEPVREINGFHRELMQFLTDFTKRLTDWHDAGPPISKDGKAALMQALYLCSDGLSQLAQKLDGR